MQELDSVGQEREAEKKNWNVPCVVLSVTTWCTCCGSIYGSSKASFVRAILLGAAKKSFGVLLKPAVRQIEGTWA